MPMRLRTIAACWLLGLALVGCGNGAAEMPPPEAGERDVTFETADGVELHGRLFGEGDVGVVLAHMFPTDGASSWFDGAQALADEGYLALAFSSRGYEQSAGEEDPSKNDLDVRAAYDFLVSRGLRSVALVGASMGATAAIILAADVDAAALVAVSPTVSFGGLDASGPAAHVEEPTLLMAAEEDAAAEAVRMLAGSMGSAETALYPGAAHGTTLLEEQPASLRRLVAFLTEHAPPAGGP